MRGITNKRIINLVAILALVMSLILLFAACNPDNGEQQGTEQPGGETPGGEQPSTPVSEGLTYRLSDDGRSYEVTGIGECTDTELVIPSEYNGLPVTGIGYGAFSDCTGLTSITIPDSVTSIGVYAFNGCSGLTSVTIPDSVTSIGGAAFASCSSLASITIPFVGASNEWTFDTHFGYIFGGYDYVPDSLKEVIITGGTIIGNYAFRYCSGLTSVTIGNGVTRIGEYAFNGCSGLTSVTIPDSVTSIGRGAFNGCSSLESITIPFVGAVAGKTSSDTRQYPFGYIFGTPSYTGATEVNQYFYGGSTSSTTWGTYYIPSSLRSVTVTGGNILYGAFYNCSMLTSVTIPDSVTSIGESAFLRCSGLTSVTIPDSVTSIGERAFYDCTAEIIWGDTPEITEIGDYAFSGYEGTSITIPDSVTSIGKYAFYDCSGLTSITVEEGNSVYHSANNCLIETASKTLVTGCETSVIPDDGSVTSIGERAFRYCSGLTTVTIPDSVTSIGEYAFNNCSGLTSVIIGNGVTSIGESAFLRCSGLTSVTIPDSVTSIGERAFYDCTAEIIWGDTPEITEIGDYAFSGYEGTSITIPDSVTSIGEYAFYDCSGLTSVTIGNGVTSIGDYAFEDCSGLTSVTIPDSVTSIGSLAFYDCSGLTSITIPDSVTSIGSSALSGCSSLESITIPFVGATKEGTSDIHLGYIFGAWSSSDNYDYVPTSLKEVIITGGTRIGNYAFRGCSGLTSVTIPDSVTSIGSNAFNGCTAEIVWGDAPEITEIGNRAFYGYEETSITIPNSVTSIGQYAFEACTAEIVWGDNPEITEIGGDAFYGYEGTSIIIPDSVTSIGSGAFSGCSSLESMTIPFVGNKADKTSSGTYQYPFGYIFGTSSYTGGEAVGQYYYGNSTSSTTYNYYYIPSSLRSVTVTGGNILYGAFYNCSMLTSITIPDSVTSIGERAFYGCSDLTSITIPDSVTSIGERAFYGCSDLTSITIPDSVTSIGDYAFYGCDKLIYNVYGNAYYLGNDNNQYILLIKAKDKSITSCTIPEQTKFIYDNAFDGCSGLTSVTIGNGVTSIGYRAFYQCSSLTSVTIPDSVTSIGEYAFQDSDIEYFSIHDGVTSIGDGAFASASSKIVDFRGSVEDWCRISERFNVSSMLSSAGKIYINGSLLEGKITIPSDVTTIAYNLFAGTDITSCRLHEDVTSIGSGAFRGCKKLKSITIPYKCWEIGSTAFIDSGLEDAHFLRTKNWYMKYETGESPVSEYDLMDGKKAAAMLRSTSNTRWRWYVKI